MQASAAYFYGVFCLVPVIAVWAAVRLAWHRLRLGQSTVWTLYRLNRFISYFHTLYLIPFIYFAFALGFYFSQHLPTHWLVVVSTMVIAVLCFVILKVCYTLLTYRFRQKIHQFSLTRLQAVAATAAQSALIASLYGFLYAVLLLLPQAWVKQHQLLIVLVIAILFVAVSIFGAELAPQFMRAKKMPPEDLPASWLDAMHQANLNNIQFYLWATRKSKMLNAMATGFFQRKIVVADYLLDAMSEEEATAIVFHELGHHHYRHLWWNLLIFICWLPLAQLVYYLLILAQVPVGVSAFLLLIGLGLYYGTVFKWFMRRFEYQADGFSFRFVGPHLAASLETLTEKSCSPRDVPRFDELWRTHPSTARRISHLQRLRHTTKNG